MGLSVSLSNALSGMNTTQKGLEVLSRNVSNAGTPGYHKQSVSLSEQWGNRSAHVYLAGVTRAFSSALERQYADSLSSAGYHDVRADFLNRLETVMGTPGDTSSVDTLYRNFESALQGMATTPDDYTTRAQVISTAQALASSLNRLSQETQSLRQETESQIASHVTDLNQMLLSLQDINEQLTNQTGDSTSRASILDERDRIISQISELVDLRVEYRQDDTVALSTSTGLGLLDKGATQFEFRSAGALSASASFSVIDSENSVGTLHAITPSGLRLDVVEQGVITSGRIGGLISLRDQTLVETQNQLDEIAAALAQAFSTNTTDGTVVAGPPDGFSIDAGNVLAGNDITLNYSVNGQAQTVRVVRVDDTSKLPMDTTGPNGERVIGVDFSGGMAAVAATLDAALGAAITVSNPSGNLLQFVDDGVANTSDITSVQSHTTATATQGAGLALGLFVDSSGVPFSNSLDGTAQKVGFAARISVNQQIVANNQLLVQDTVGGSLGSTARADFLLDQLQNMTFTGSTKTSQASGAFRLSGRVSDLINQTLNFQGKAIGTANSQHDQAKLTLEATNMRMDESYGVNVDEEMARLMELQNSYAASARVVSVVQELLDALMGI